TDVGFEYDLHSLPTRRSSDLQGWVFRSVRWEKGGPAPPGVAGPGWRGVLGLEGVAGFLDGGRHLLVGEVLAGDGDLAGFVGGFDAGDAADLADLLLHGHFAVSAGHAFDGVVLGVRCHGGFLSSLWIRDKAGGVPDTF